MYSRIHRWRKAGIWDRIFAAVQQATDAAGEPDWEIHTEDWTMEETTRNDIRRLLKVFGVQADEALMAHLDKHPGVPVLHLRITLEDLTEYGTPRQRRCTFKLRARCATE